MRSLLNSSTLYRKSVSHSSTQLRSKINSQSLNLRRSLHLGRINPRQESLPAWSILFHRLLFKIDSERQVAHWTSRLLTFSTWLDIHNNASSLRIKYSRYEWSPLSPNQEFTTYAKYMTTSTLDRFLTLIQANPTSNNILRGISRRVSYRSGRRWFQHKIGMISHLSHSSDEGEEIRIVVE